MYEYEASSKGLAGPAVHHWVLESGAFAAMEKTVGPD